MHRLLIAALVLLLSGPAATGDEAKGGAPKPGSPEALQVLWLERPGDIARGIRLQDALAEAGRQRSGLKLFRTQHAQAKDDPRLSFLHGRARGDAAGLVMMREAWTGRLGNAIGDTSGMLEASIALAVVEVRARNGKGAAAAAEMITDMRGGAADWTYLGWIRQYLLRTPEPAIDAYAKALRKDAKHQRARNALIGLRLERGEVEPAHALAKTGTQLHPASSAAHLQLGEVFLAKKLRAKALASYAQAAKTAGTDADALAAVGAAYADLDEVVHARLALKKALAADPAHGGALTQSAMLAMDAGKHKEARGLLKRAAKVRPRHARVAFLEGMCAQRLGMHSSAVSSFRRAMELESSNVDYVKALAFAHVEKGSLPSAIMMFKRAIKMDAKDADLRMQLGIALYKKRSYKPARDAFQEAAVRDPDNARPHYYLALIQGDKLGKSKDALAALERYAALGGKDATALAWLEDLRAQLGKK